jgi:hypothetical protein
LAVCLAGFAIFAKYVLQVCICIFAFRQIRVLKKRYFHFTATKEAVMAKMSSKIGKTCWGCKHNDVKLRVLVPQNATIRDYVRITANMCSELVAIIKQQQGLYTLWFRYGFDLKKVTVKIVQTCKQKVETNKKETPCPQFLLDTEPNLVSNIIYCKVPIPDVNKIMVPKTSSTAFIAKLRVLSPA